jgi:hypothetical protein
MAKMDVVPVLAVARKSLQIRNELEMQEFPLQDDQGQPAIDPATGKVRTEIRPTWIPVFCEPGTVIDISEWKNAGAYENRGEIQILGPVEARQAWELMQQEAREAAQVDEPEPDPEPDEPEEIKEQDHDGHVEEARPAARRRPQERSGSH